MRGQHKPWSAQPAARPKEKKKKSQKLAQVESSGVAWSRIPGAMRRFGLLIYCHQGVRGLTVPAVLPGVGLCEQLGFHGDSTKV